MVDVNTVVGDPVEAPDGTVIIQSPVWPAVSPPAAVSSKSVPTGGKERSRCPLSEAAAGLGSLG
jgi:uncharacterized spore protein YtfJ